MRAIFFTTQYKKDLKLALKRNLPEEKLNEVIKNSLKTFSSLRQIWTIRLKGNIKAAANVIFSLIGC